MPFILGLGVRWLNNVSRHYLRNTLNENDERKGPGEWSLCFIHSQVKKTYNVNNISFNIVF